MRNADAKRSAMINMKDTDNKPKLKLVKGDNPKGKSKPKGRSALNSQTGLTDKQEAFVQQVFQGRNYSDAYRAAYDADRMTDKTVNEESCRLAATPKVTARLAQLQREREQVQRMQRLTRAEKVIEKLEEIALRDTEDGHTDGTQVRAIELLGKTLGLFVDRVETEDKTERDAETIRSELMQRLERLR